MNSVDEVIVITVLFGWAVGFTVAWFIQRQRIMEHEQTRRHLIMVIERWANEAQEDERRKEAMAKGIEGLAAKINRK